MKLFHQIVLVLGAAALLAAGTHLAVRWQLPDSARAADPPTVGPSAFKAFYGVTPSSDQLAILADGVVTEAELRAALSRAADCIESMGVQPVRLGHPQLEGHLVLGVFVPDRGDTAQASAAVRLCEGRHSGIASATYAAQNPRPTPVR